MRLGLCGVDFQLQSRGGGPLGARRAKRWDKTSKPLLGLAKRTSAGNLSYLFDWIVTYMYYLRLSEPITYMYLCM